PVPALEKVDQHTILEIAKTLRSKKNVLLLLGGGALRAKAQEHAGRIEAKFGCQIMTECLNGLHQRGRGRLPLSRVPYPAAPAIAALASVEHLILVGAKAPVGFFAYPDMPSKHYPDTAEVQVLARLEQDVEGALEALAEELSCGPAAVRSASTKAEIPTGLPTSYGFGQMLAAVMPEESIVVDEGISFGFAFYDASHNAPPHDWMNVTGGAIGYGLPAATGAAIAGKGRRVICPQADGSGMYTLQALWTQAREILPVTTVILANRKYQILLAEYANVGANPGQTALDMLDLGRPDLDWVKLANGMGVEAAQATTLEECAELMRVSFKRDGPFVIELVI
ncbi:MAG: acetolactate synthase large subunit, partial [Rhizobiaceae bacterium]